MELEWQQFDGEPRQAIAARHAWARSIGGALQMMVDDRCTDLDLEQLEHAGGKDRGVWELD